ncbi:histamine N-methyltransferase-like [Paramormyrops kingsleyae]|uniref:Histamine N-methyltransferase n=1 Tax=Paramormyrops kingsleyae TaxID=1676925 RepID=A0A3B3T9W3_9TELE|nr:histamine N-methyltransferase-like [Paramormyrops kingsleyae]XP_023649507.1 histamine N-methyltransferase-like [Paramormyrops kingsleyae]
MTSPMKSLSLDYERFHKCFRISRQVASEHQVMYKFIRESLPGILASTLEGKTTFDVVSLGSGTGEVDLEILSQLSKVLPDVKVGCDMVEPSEPMLEKCKELVSRTPSLDDVNFTWNQMTASEFEKHWRDSQPEKKVDFIHMIQMLYYEVDPAAAVSFYRSLLNKDGKLLIMLNSGECGWSKLWSIYGNELYRRELKLTLTAADIKRNLTAEGISFEAFVLPSTIDITDCFIPGDEKGELVLDWLTSVVDFRRTAPPELKAGVMDLLRSPDFTTEVDGRALFSCNLEVLVLGQ